MLHVNKTTLDAAWDIQLWTVISSLPALAVISCMQHVSSTSLDNHTIITIIYRRSS